MTITWEIINQQWIAGYLTSDGKLYSYLYTLYPILIRGVFQRWFHCILQCTSIVRGESVFRFTHVIFISPLKMSNAGLLILECNSYMNAEINMSAISEFFIV